ncbi:MAG: hypothetical protein OJF59_000625 [Cytophagales bacterium]|jgi:hypothetical protein|nr:MAG: hypothetical protein OJF59_000625 [Cytophagales bacterium]
MPLSRIFDMNIRLILYLFFSSYSLFAQRVVIENKSAPSFSEHDIRNELKVYPSNVLNLCVEQILVKDFNDKTYYGLSHTAMKYVEINSIIPTKIDAIKTLHHELSSMFLHNVDQDYSERTYKVYGKKFIALNPNGFRYERGIRVTDLNDEQRKYFAIDTYSMDSFENDFNRIAETLFADPAYLNHLNTSLPVYKKFLLVVEFYHNYVDPKFTMEYFQNLKR